MGFDKCCDKRDMYEYNMLHDGKFDNRKNDLFLKALWRLPETDSKQSDEDTIFMNSAYDDFL